MTQIVALVLAGGRARRMGGGDKPLLEIGGRTMLARVLDALHPEVVAAAISANGDPSRFAGFGLPVLDDGRFAGEGPLAGLLAGLDWAAGRGAGALLSAPGDTPFLPAGLAARLAPAPSFAAWRGRDHPLVGLWPIAARQELRRFLAAPDSRAVAAFSARIGGRRVPFPETGDDPFRNVNTPADLTAARAAPSLRHHPCIPEHD